MEFLKQQYKQAELTCLCFHNRIENRYYHLYSVIELIPLESAQTKNTGVKRIALNKEVTVYIENKVLDNVATGLQVFQDPFNSYQIESAKIYFVNQIFPQEPEGDAPIILPNNLFAENRLSAVLPRRTSSLRLWAKIDVKRETKAIFTEEEWVKIGKFTQDNLGFDISVNDEHIGNMYLCGPNPYYRSIDLTLARKSPGVYCRINLRKGAKLNDICLRFEDKRGNNISFSIDYYPKTISGFVGLPHEPHMFGIKVLDKHGNLIGDEGASTFIKSTKFDMGVKESDLIIEIKDGDKIEKRPPIPKYSHHKGIEVKRYSEDYNLGYYFKNSERLKKHITNEKNNTVITYLSSDNAIEKEEKKRQAKEKIRELINIARYRCIICDPYFGIKDLWEFVYHIQNISVDVRILSSKMFLSERIPSEKVKGNAILISEIQNVNANLKASSEEKLVNIQKLMDENEQIKRGLKTNAEALLEGIKEYNNKPFQKLKCRFLNGKQSKLHDRFLIIDDNVWLLGSSLNEFGNRATTIVKIDGPIEIIRAVEEWWESNEETEDLESYISKNADI